jgi:ribosomal protein S8
MVKTSVLNDCLNAINNAEKAGKRQVMIRPSSKVIVKFLTVMQRHGMSQSYAHIALSVLSYSPLSSYLPTSPPPSG